MSHDRTDIRGDRTLGETGHRGGASADAARSRPDPGRGRLRRWQLRQEGERGVREQRVHRHLRMGAADPDHRHDLHRHPLAGHAAGEGDAGGDRHEGARDPAQGASAPEHLAGQAAKQQLDQLSTDAQNTISTANSAVAQLQGNASASNIAVAVIALAPQVKNLASHGPVGGQDVEGCQRLARVGVQERRLLQEPGVAVRGRSACQLGPAHEARGRGSVKPQGVV